MLNAYLRSRCACQFSGIDFSLRCAWLLDAHINDNARQAKRGLNNAVKLYKLIVSERLRPKEASKVTKGFSSRHVCGNNNNTNSNANKGLLGKEIIVETCISNEKNEAGHRKLVDNDGLDYNFEK